MHRWKYRVNITRLLRYWSDIHRAVAYAIVGGVFYYLYIGIELVSNNINIRPSSVTRARRYTASASYGGNGRGARRSKRIKITISLNGSRTSRESLFYPFCGFVEFIGASTWSCLRYIARRSLFLYIWYVKINIRFSLCRIAIDPVLTLQAPLL